MNLLSNSTIFAATGILSNLFDTISRQIVINKEPIQVINTGVITTIPNGLYGYGTASFTPQEVTFQPVSGVFPAVVLYNYRLREFGTPISEETQVKLIEGKNYIKVRPDAANFIEGGGRVLNISVDNKLWNLGTIRNAQSFFTHQALYYYYNLVETN